MQRADLHEVLTRHEPLFCGITSWELTHTRSSIFNSIPPTVPHSIRSAHNILLKSNMNRSSRTSWTDKSTKASSNTALSPFGAWHSLCSQRKTKQIHTIQNLRPLNACILRQQYAFPKIQDIVLHHRNYNKFLTTKIDLNMQYYCFILDEESS
jgi:hypothetical protein